MELPLRPVRQLGDAVLRDRLVALEQVVNSAQAAQAQLMAEMARRADATDAADALHSPAAAMPHQRRSEFVADEIAVVLRCTKMVAATRYGLALAAAEHQPVMTAWAAGRIDARKVQVICDGLRDVSEPAVGVLASQAAEHAATHTAPEVRRWFERAGDHRRPRHGRDPPHPGRGRPESHHDLPARRSL